MPVARVGPTVSKSADGTVPGVADLDRCRQAFADLSDRLRASGRELPERTVSCTVTDLGVTFHTLLDRGGFGAITTEPQPPAQVRITVVSDDLVALVTGELHAGAAFASGRLGIKASFRDLMLLRSLG